MRAASVIGIILIIIGTAGLIWGGFEFPRTREVAEVGPVEVQAETQEEISIPGWLAGLALGGGVVLVIVGSRKT
ncbi:MAG: hypothetical protein R3314_05825 [Longimicrobiales bacterium]|nr:hypothetical protein [Longimicrobiales bacterium]